MSWDEESARRTFERRSRVELLWIRALAERPSTGPGKARNFHSVTGKVRSIAKQLDVEEPAGDEVKRAFDGLRNATIRGPEGNYNSFILGDKEDYVKLTRVGKNIVNEVHSRETICRVLEEEIGVEFEEGERWWPEKYDESAAEIIVYTTSDRPEDDSGSYQLEATAEFYCEQCGANIEHKYPVLYPDEAWSDHVAVECPNDDCDITWRHMKGNVYDRPEPD